ncbi:MAG: ABC-F family ATP-binding cassette domain-containing protein, partial [Clostridiales bacterium]|nr:ABC-F family ATP-binding cassette domain-containing protein [Clostridiales bacterium]
MLISAEQITKNYGTKQLLDDVSLYINERDHIGIVGINGTGKSTLLKILVGIEPPDEGSISINPDLQISYLSQNPVMKDDFTVMEQVLSEFSPQDEVNEYEVKATLTRLGITEFSATIGTLSGGQRKRVALCATLINPADVLVLDEPTNHLDSDMTIWLEQYLSRFTGGIIMVTHDRYFLERVANRIVELSHSKLYTYEANYSKYLEQKAERIDMDFASERKRQAFLRREYQWIMQGPKARGTKSRDRIERYESLIDQAAPVVDDTVQLSTISSRLGKKLIELDEVTKSYDNHTIIDRFTYHIQRDDRIGIVGKNGVGKSTLLNLISGQVEPDEGRVEVGSTVQIGYFTQEGQEIDKSLRVYDFISEIAGEIKTEEG